jgi:hypothetical protein
MTEIFTANGTARLRVIVDRDEPFREDNQIWMNWGVFDNTTDDDLSKVHGSRDYFIYKIETFYDEYFDRILIRNMWL